MSDLTPGNNPLRQLLKKRVQKDVPFQGEKIKIQQLTVAEVEQIQTAGKQMAELAKAWDAYNSRPEGSELTEPDKTPATANKELTLLVLNLGVVGAGDLTAEDIAGTSMDAFNKLAESIMEYSGLAQEKQGK